MITFQTYKNFGTKDFNFTFTEGVDREASTKNHCGKIKKKSKNCKIKISKENIKFLQSLGHQVLKKSI